MNFTVAFFDQHRNSIINWQKWIFILILHVMLCICHHFHHFLGVWFRIHCLANTMKWSTLLIRNWCSIWTEHMQIHTHGRQVCRCARLILRYGELGWQSMPSIDCNFRTHSWNSWNIVASASYKHYKRRNSYDVIVTGTSWDRRHIFRLQWKWHYLRMLFLSKVMS